MNMKSVTLEDRDDYYVTLEKGRTCLWFHQAAEVRPQAGVTMTLYLTGKGLKAIGVEVEIVSTNEYEIHKEVTEQVHAGFKDALSTDALQVKRLGSYSYSARGEKEMLAVVVVQGATHNLTCSPLKQNMTDGDFGFYYGDSYLQVESPAAQDKHRHFHWCPFKISYKNSWGSESTRDISIGVCLPLLQTRTAEREKARKTSTEKRKIVDFFEKVRCYHTSPTLQLNVCQFENLGSKKHLLQTVQMLRARYKAACLVLEHPEVLSCIRTGLDEHYDEERYRDRLLQLAWAGYYEKVKGKNIRALRQMYEKARAGLWPSLTWKYGVQAYLKETRQLWEKLKEIRQAVAQLEESAEGEPTEDGQE